MDLIPKGKNSQRVLMCPQCIEWTRKIDILRSWLAGAQQTS